MGDIAVNLEQMHKQFIEFEENYNAKSLIEKTHQKCLQKQQEIEKVIVSGIEVSLQDNLLQFARFTKETDSQNKRRFQKFDGEN